MKVLMVCLGNICRSPLAEGILKNKAKEHGLDLMVDSAGTANYHQGELPDPRSIEKAKEYFIDITDQRARQFMSSDFKEFDHILVMDSSNFQNVMQVPGAQEYSSKVKHILNYAYPGQNKAVPDPYYGKEDGFQLVYELLDKALEGFIKKELND